MLLRLYGLLLTGFALAGAVTGQTTVPPKATPAAPAQVTPAAGAGQTPTISVTANLVNLPVTVRDKKGNLVTNLTAADFTLSVDGHAQTIRYFDRDQNLPLTVGLLVDTSQSQRTVLDEEETASSTFLDQMLTTPADRAFLVQFAREVELLQDLTNSRPKLQAGIKEIGTPNPNEHAHNDDDDASGSNGNGNGNNGGHGRGGGTTLYDAVYLSSNELLKKQQGRKAIIILSDGVDRNSKETLNAAIEAAQRSDTIIYAIYFKGEERHDNGGFPGGRSGGGYPGGGGGYPGGGGGYPGGGGGYPGGGRNGGNRGGQQPVNDIDGKRILQQMVDETGGRLFEAKKGRIADDFSQIAEELRSQYRLGYTPDATITGDGYHQVDLRIPAQKNDKVQTRDGYYSGK